jgi:membrane protein DedA with SNARE-associated domain
MRIETMIARLLVSFGASIAAVGFTLLGMATSYVKHDDDMKSLSFILMAAGVAATVIGALWYRMDERKAEDALRTQAARANQSVRR